MTAGALLWASIIWALPMNWDEASRLYEEGLTVFESLDDPMGVVIIYGNLGDLAFTNQEISEAKTYYGRGLEISLKNHAVYASSTLLFKAAALMAAEGDVEDAAWLLEFVTDHPGTSQAVRENTKAALEPLKKQLPPDWAPFQAGDAPAIEQVIAMVLRQWGYSAWE